MPGVETWCIDYREFVPSEIYDALISIEMVDHLVAPEQQRKGLAVAIYRDYDDYQARTSRDIPVLILTPRGGA